MGSFNRSTSFFLVNLFYNCSVFKFGKKNTEGPLGKLVCSFETRHMT